MVYIPYQRKVSCAVVGDGMVGKTCFIKSFLGETFSEKYEATSFDVFSGYPIKDGERYFMEIYDFAGERDEGILLSPKLHKCHVIVVCFNVNDPESYDGVDSFWLPLLQKLCRKPKIIITGLQDDKKSKIKKSVIKRMIEGNELRLKTQGIEVMYCSALHGEKIGLVFSKIIDIAVKLNKKKSRILKGVFLKR